MKISEDSDLECTITPEGNARLCGVRVERIVKRNLWSCFRRPTDSQSNDEKDVMSDSKNQEQDEYVRRDPVGAARAAAAYMQITNIAVK